MTPLEYEVAFFAQSVWRLANSSDFNEMVAVACTIRNWVIPKLGAKSIYGSYTEACKNFLLVYPTRDEPDLNDPAFVSPEGLLSVISDIYNCEYPDVTSTQSYPLGARHFARVTTVEPNSWFKTEVIGDQQNHPLLGTFGSMQFYG